MALKFLDQFTVIYFNFVQCCVVHCDVDIFKLTTSDQSNKGIDPVEREVNFLFIFMQLCILLLKEVGSAGLRAERVILY